MLKKLFFIPLCLSLSLSPVAYSQQAQESQNTIEHHEIKDANTLTEIVKQLPEKDQALIKEIISEKKDAHETSLFVRIFVALAIVVPLVIVLLDKDKFEKEKETRV